jgi:hypothetical protein
MPRIGKVLWWDRRDGEGIVVDAAGKQFYFNRSGMSPLTMSKMRDDLLIQFEISKVVKHLSCAEAVQVIAPKQRKQAEKTFLGQMQLELGGL